MSLRHCYSWVGALCIITMQHKNRPRLLQQPRRIFMSSYIFSRLNVLSLLTPHPRVQLELYSCFTYQTYTVLSKVCPPASSVTSKSDRLCKSPSLVLNLPGWRWGSITQNPLVAVSRPLHSGVCETRQDIGLPVLHSEISDSGLLRTRGDQQYKDDFWIY